MGRRHLKNDVELKSDFRPRRCFANDSVSIMKGRKMNGYTQIMKKLTRGLIFVLVAIIILTMCSRFFNKRNKNSNPDNCHYSKRPEGILSG